MDDKQILEQAQSMIRAEGKVVEEIADQLGGSFVAAAHLIAEAKGVVLTTGAGTSGTMARRSAHLLSTCGLRAFYISSAEALHGPSAAISPGDVLIVLSKAGKSAELNQFATVAKERGWPMAE